MGDILSRVEVEDGGIQLLLALRMVEYARARAKATGRPEDLHPSDLEDVRELLASLA